MLVKVSEAKKKKKESLSASAVDEGFIAGDEQAGNKPDHSSYVTVSLMLFFCVRNFCSCQNSFFLLHRGQGWICLFVSGIQYFVCRNEFPTFFTKANISVTVSCVYILYTLLLGLYPSWKCCYSDVIFKVCFTFVVSNNIMVRIEAFLSHM